MMVGHAEQESIFAGAFFSGRMPHAWLLAGPKGIGKAHFAMRAAAFLLTVGRADARAGSASLDPQPGHPALPLLANGAHPDCFTLRREVPDAKRPKDGSPGNPDDVARSITIAQVRSLLARLRIRPADDGRRCIIIDSIDDLERGAANALLKTLEEPPERSVFLLVTHNPGRLLPTIRSRCRMLRFAPLDLTQMRVALEQAPTSGDELLDEELLALASGSPGRALQYADTRTDGALALLQAMVDGGDRDNRLRVELARAISGAGAAKRVEMLALQAGHIAADAARTRQGDAMLRALTARQRIADVASRAVSGSEDPASVAFAIGNALSEISPR